MKIREKTFWWIITILCVIPQMARITHPLLASYPLFVSIQLFALATLISIAVSASVITSPLFGKSEDNGYKDRIDSSKNGKRIIIVKYGDYYRLQKRAALIISLVIWSLLVVLYITEQMGGDIFWFLLPFSLIGPVLYLRDWLK